MLQDYKVSLPVPTMIQREVASQLGVSRRTLSNWRKAGFGPPPIQVGRTLLYDAAAVEAFARGVR